MKTSVTTAVYALTPQGAALGEKVARALGGELYLPASLAFTPYAGDGGKEESAPRVMRFERFGDQIRESFRRYPRHVFICAAGIAVRIIAPLLGTKYEDPAVAVLDQKGKFAISLLSGHMGGANRLAADVAAITGGRAVITTATDTEGLPSADMLALEAGVFIRNPAAVKTVNAAFLAGRRVALYDPNDRLGLRASPWRECFEYRDSLEKAWCGAAISVTARELDPEDGSAGHCVLHPPVLYAGIGCRRGIAAAEVAAAIREGFAAVGLSVHSLASIASVSIKRDEAGIYEAAALFSLVPHFFSPEELAAVPVLSPSPKVRELLGIDGVAESAALLSATRAAAWSKGRAVLVLPKTARHGVTFALAAVLPGEDAVLE